MTDGISEAWDAQRRYEDWDAPHCYVCVRKVSESRMEDHIKNHSVSEVITALTRWSIDSWKEENKRSKEEIENVS